MRNSLALASGVWLLALSSAEAALYVGDELVGRLPRIPTESFCRSALASIARGELSQAELEQLPPSTIDSTAPIDSPHTGDRGGERLVALLPADLIIAYELLRKSQRRNLRVRSSSLCDECST
jgi:hypothetical protein